MVPFYRSAINLFLEGRGDDFIKLFEWVKRDKNKKYVIKDSLPYYVIPFFQDQYIRVSILARAIDSSVVSDQ